MSDDPFLNQPGQPRQPEQQMQPAQPGPVTPPPAAPPASGQPAQYQPQQYPPPPYAAPQYPQPGYAAVPYAPVTKPKTWMNWTAMGCGIGGLFTCGLSAIPAIVFGHMGLSASNKGEADARGAGIAGLVLGYLAVVGAVAYVALVVILAASGDFQ